jgi:hypothetical protein
MHFADPSEGAQQHALRFCIAASSSNSHPSRSREAGRHLSQAQPLSARQELPTLSILHCSAHRTAPATASNWHHQVQVWWQSDMHPARGSDRPAWNRSRRSTPARPDFDHQVLPRPGIRSARCVKFPVRWKYKPAQAAHRGRIGIQLERTLELHASILADCCFDSPSHAHASAFPSSASTADSKAGAPVPIPARDPVHGR